MLAPLLRTGGYHVVSADADGAGQADIIIVFDDALPDSLATKAIDTPVVRLTARADAQDEELVYRYDRHRLLETLRVKVERRRAGR